MLNSFHRRRQHLVGISLIVVQEPIPSRSTLPLSPAAHAVALTLTLYRDGWQRLQYSSGSSVSLQSFVYTLANIPWYHYLQRRPIQKLFLVCSKLFLSLFLLINGHALVEVLIIRKIEHCYGVP